MPKFNQIQTNFTAGELAPRMLGRVDVVRYNNGAEILENVVAVIQGGVKRRPGTLYTGTTKDSTKRSRLLPYIFTVDQAYQLEFGDGYMRVYAANGAQIQSSPGVPFEIASPYTQAQLADIDFCQRADTMFLFHEAVPPQRLQRFGNADWRLAAVPFVTEPFDEVPFLPTAALSWSNGNVGTGRIFTAGTSVFQPSDVGRGIAVMGGYATITGYTSGTSVTATITSQFDGGSAVQNAWSIDSSPQTSMSPSIKEPAGAQVTLTAGSAAFRNADVGKHVVINGGLVEITSITSATVALGIIRVAMAATVAAEASAWVLCGSQWGAQFGWPRTGTIYQQRLWAAGSPGFPQSAWMSRLGEYYDFEIGTEPNSGFQVGVDSDQANPIRNIASARALIVNTSSSEFTIRGSDGAAITPTTVDVQSQSAFGASNVAPVRVGNELLFPNRSGRKIRAMSADRFDASAYAAPDITALAEHITESGIVDMDAHSEPESLVWAVRADGVMAVCTIDRDNDVLAWTRQITDGAFESVSVIPNGDSYQVWAIVRRTIGGVQKRYVERFDWDVYVDCGILGSTGIPSDTWSGLSHLAGKTVAVLADGVIQTPAVVSGAGSAKIRRPARTVQIGLPFIPKVKMMVPEAVTQAGTAQGLPMRTVSISVRVLDTIGVQINGRELPFNQYGHDVLDVPPPPYTGLKKAENLSFAVGQSDVVITQNDPGPFHLLSVIRQVEVNDG